MFDKEKFDDLCWMMTMKKNFRGVPQGALFSERDCFKLFCLFNLLSEDRYPLVMIAEEVKGRNERGLFNKQLMAKHWQALHFILRIFLREFAGKIGHVYCAKSKEFIEKGKWSDFRLVT